MARTKLVGDYGKLAKGVLGTEVVAAATLVADTWYIPTGIDASTAMPTGVTLKYMFMADGTETLSGDDKAKPVTFTDLCDIQSWSMDFSKDEIEVTTLCSTDKEYLSGRSDISGSVEGVYTIGTTDTDGGFINAFVDIVRQADAGGTITIDTIDDSPIYLQLYKQKDGSSGETQQFYLIPSIVTATTDGVSSGAQQSFSGTFKPTPDSEVNRQLVSIKYT
ncbi:MAG: hypothetical protein JRJ00_00260 [Deltaproteobacteria bacterium]|nr:hypothetical protein [Deltaproteobacteria bacterium]